MSETIKWRTNHVWRSVVFLGQCPLIYGDLKQILGEEQRKSDLTLLTLDGAADLGAAVFPHPAATTTF